jgi:hypothetical protein
MTAKLQHGKTQEETMNLWDVVKQPLRQTFRAASQFNLMMNKGKYRFIFVLGHMRSGSTLLAHILASHPDIVGAGEMHISYQTPTDLQNLVLKTCEFLHKPFLRESYIVDQINHEYVTDQVLLSEKVSKCVILLREPEATLKSLMNLPIKEEKQALELYLKRLDALVHYGSVLRGKAMLVDYDDFIDHTDRTLSSLTNFLGLESPLSPNYATHRMTGRVLGYGDPSSNIKAGRIVRTAKHNINVSEETLIAAATIFRNSREQLQATVRHATQHKASSN